MKRFLMFVAALFLPGGFLLALCHFGKKHFSLRNFFNRWRGVVKNSLQTSRGCGKLCTLS